MKALVTGASGFVGGFVVRELLRQGHSVTGLVRRASSVSALAAQGMQVAVGDISQSSTLSSSVPGHDVVIHLAAVVGKDPGDWRNHQAHGVEGTRNMLLAAQAGGVPHFVHLSSCIVYRAPSGPVAVTEDSPLESSIEPWNHYLRQKLECEAVLRSGARGLRVSVLRPPTVIGPGDPNLIGLLSAIARSPLGAVARDVNNHMPVIVAEDLAVGVVQAALHTDADVYNLAAARTLTKAELLALFEQAGARLRPPSLSRKLALGAAVSASRGLFRALGLLDAERGRALERRVVQRLENHAQRRAQPDLLIDTTRAQKKLGFRGERDLAEAIQKTVEFQLSAGGAS